MPKRSGKVPARDANERLRAILEQATGGAAHPMERDEEDATPITRPRKPRARTTGRKVR